MSIYTECAGAKSSHYSLANPLSIRDHFLLAPLLLFIYMKKFLMLCSSSNLTSAIHLEKGSVSPSVTGSPLFSLLISTDCCNHLPREEACWPLLLYVYSHLIMLAFKCNLLLAYMAANV